MDMNISIDVGHVLLTIITAIVGWLVHTLWKMLRHERASDKQAVSALSAALENHAKRDDEEFRTLGAKIDANHRQVMDTLLQR